jgi:ATP-dependent HslUV protease, peptidase subunit HslV
MTTILAVSRDNRVVLGGDGQVSLGNNVMKAGARKVRRIHDGSVVCGFAGSTADAMTLSEKLEAKLGEYSGNLTRAAVELAKDWRSDKYLRRLEAMLIAADKDRILMISGTGDVIEPDEGVVAIGSGGFYALAAARALLRHTELDARQIAEQSLGIAAELCVFTNDQFTIEEIGQ